MRFQLKVTADDGTETAVVAGQREMAAWERQFRTSSLAATKEQPLLFFRFLAYSALRRSLQLEHVDGKPPDFDTWDSAIDAVDVDDDEDEDDADDPTKTDQSPAG